jgi:hypothetical protein
MSFNSKKSLISEKTVVYHECDGNCIPVESSNSELHIIISMIKWKFRISMEYLLSNYFGGISKTSISNIVMLYVPFVITVNASEIDDSSVDYEIGVILDKSVYIPNFVMSVSVEEIVPNFNTFSVTTKNNDCVVEYGNDVCVHDVTEMFVREVEFIINSCED